jgi:hypothetical protein
MPRLSSAVGAGLAALLIATLPVPSAGAATDHKSGSLSASVDSRKCHKVKVHKHHKVRYKKVCSHHRPGSGQGPGTGGGTGGGGGPH